MLKGPEMFYLKIPCSLTLHLKLIRYFPDIFASAIPRFAVRPWTSFMPCLDDMISKIKFQHDHLRSGVMDYRIYLENLVQSYFTMEGSHVMFKD